jgi:type IV pilus assembly protein PilX
MSRPPSQPGVASGWRPAHRLVRRRQHGASLIIALVMLVAVLMLGISSTQIALQGEKASRNERDRVIAFQAAEAGLMDAELDIEKSASSNSRSAIFSPASKEGFTEGCGAGTDNIYLGLCARAENGTPPVWQTVDFLDESDSARTVPYGYFTGQTFDIGNGPLPNRPPRYIIELMAYNRAGEAAGPEEMTYLYRVTAIGFGTRAATQVVLQTFYRKDGI